MTVFINNQPVELHEGSSLADALAQKEIKPDGIATAINGIVINRSARAETTLKDGDKILIIKAFCGG